MTVTVNDGKGGTAQDTVNIAGDRGRRCATTRSKTCTSTSIATRSGRKRRASSTRPITALQRGPDAAASQIEGHTCNIGTAEYNLALGDRARQRGARLPDQPRRRRQPADDDPLLARSGRACDNAREETQPAQPSRGAGREPAALTTAVRHVPDRTCRRPDLEVGRSQKGGPGVHQPGPPFSLKIPTVVIGLLRQAAGPARGRSRPRSRRQPRARDRADRRDRRACSRAPHFRSSNLVSELRRARRRPSGRHRGDRRCARAGRRARRRGRPPARTSPSRRSGWRARLMTGARGVAAADRLTASVAMDRARPEAVRGAALRTLEALNPKTVAPLRSGR